MKKLVIAAMLAILLFATPVFGAYGRRAYIVSVVDSLHEKNDDEVTSFQVNIAGSTAATIYANASTTTSATNPIVDSSTATDITTLTDGYVVFWYAGATCDIILSDGTYTKTHSSVTPQNTRLMYDSHLYTAMTEFELLDAESISFGTHDDWVAQCATATIMTWTPLADNSAFNIGVSGTSLNSDFNVYVGTALGFKVDAGVPSLVWDGGAATLNHNSNFNVGLCTGTSTGNTSIGSATAGTIALDTTAGITVNADDSYALTVSAGTINITSTGGDTDIDASDASVTIDGGEAVDDAINMDAAAGGLDVDVALSICFTTAESESDSMNFDCAGGMDFDISGGAAGEDFAVTTDTSITLVTTEAVADQFKLDAQGAVAGNAINLETTSGGIILTADHSANGDITLDAEDDIILTTTGALTITNTSPVTISGAFEPDIVIVPDGAAYDVLANNSGQIHIIQGQTADITMDLPAEADGLHFKFIYVGGAADAQDWLIDTENDTNFFYGGIVQHDPDAGGDDTTPYYSDEDSNSIIGVLTPECGTYIEIWCDGTNWYVTGTVISATDAGVTFADQA